MILSSLLTRKTPVVLVAPISFLLTLNNYLLGEQALKQAGVPYTINALKFEFFKKKIHTNSAIGNNIGKVFSEPTNIGIGVRNLYKWATCIHYQPPLKLIHKDRKACFPQRQCHSPPWVTKLDRFTFIAKVRRQSIPTNCEH